MSSEAAAEGRRGKNRNWWSIAFAILGVSLAAILIYRIGSRYTLDEIRDAVMMVPVSSILLSGLFALGSYITLTFFDLLALRYIGKNVSYPYIALTSFCSLSLGHNIGFAALSSGAIRYRFYSRKGVGLGDMGRVIVFCGITVMLGLVTLGGFAALWSAERVSGLTGLPAASLRIAGLVCLCMVIAYMFAGHFIRKPLTVRGQEIYLPRPAMAAAQVAVGSVNYIFVAGCLYQAVTAVSDIPFLPLASLYVTGTLTALISHVPGGLGVLESVILQFLPEGAVIGPLMIFRLVYFLVPLALGGALFAVAELVFLKRGKTNPH